MSKKRCWVKGLGLLLLFLYSADGFYQKAEDIDIKSKGFVRIPKRGVDVSFSELFEYPFMVIDRGKVEEQSALLLAISRFRKIFIRHLFDL